METKRLSAVGALVLELARQLVDRPSQTTVREMAGEQSTLLEVGVCKADYGKLIGRGGKSISNIRTLLGCISGRASRRFTLEVLEPEDPGDSAPIPEPTVGDPIPRVVLLLRRVLVAMVDHPQQVEVRCLRGEKLVLFEVQVDQDDVKRVLGRGGKSVSALRGLIQNVGVKHGLRFRLEVVDLVERMDPGRV